MKSKQRLYAAYGSNLDRRQMNARCPHHEFFARGMILDYRLTLPFYADIEPHKGDETPCVIYIVSPQDESRLDGYEGVSSGCYKKIMVQVKTESGIHEALAYMMEEAYRTEPRPIRAGYYEQILEAYEVLGFDTISLHDLILRKGTHQK